MIKFKRPLRQKYFIYRPLSLAIVRFIDFLLRFFCIKLRKKTFEVPKKLLVLTGQHMGDVLLATSILPEIKRTFPKVQIGVVAGSWARHIIEGHPSVTSVHTFDHSRLNRSALSYMQKKRRHLTTFVSTVRQLRRIRYDTALALSPFFANGIPIAFVARIPQRIGFSTGGFGAMLTHQADWQSSIEHISQGYLALLKQFDGDEREYLEMRPNVRKCWSEESDYKGAVVVHPGAGCSKKCWASSKWIEVITELSRSGQRVVLTGKGQADAERIAEIIAGLSSGIDVHNLCDKCSWSDYLTLLKHASLLLSVDTMSVHVASLFALPTVAIYTGNQHANSLFAPLNPNAVMLVQGELAVEAKDVLAKAYLTLSPQLS